MNIYKIDSTALQVEYPTICPFSQNNKYFIAAGVSGSFGIYSGETNNLIKIPPYIISTSSHPKFSRKVEDIILFINGNELKAYSILDSSIKVIRKFTEYIDIGVNEPNAESDIGFDGSHFVFYAIGKTREIFSYDLNNNTKESSYFINYTINAVKLTPSNKIVIFKTDGIFLLKENKQITSKMHHNALVNYLGEDFIIHGGAQATGENKGAIVMLSLNSLQQRQLMTFDWSKYAVHVSSCDKDFCLIELYSSLLGPANVEFWKVAFDSTIKPELIHQADFTYRNYESQPKASLSRDGAQFLFSLDDGTRTNVYRCIIDSTIQLDGLETRIDYAKLLDFEFIMRPRPDGAVDIYQRKRI